MSLDVVAFMVQYEKLLADISRTDDLFCLVYTMRHHELLLEK